MESNIFSGKTLFLNIGHFFDHMFMLLYATAVITIAQEFNSSYGKLVALATPSFILFGGMALPFGWLGDRWGRHTLITVFFIGIGISSIFTGFAENYWQIAAGLSAIGIFAAIYHPVGIPMLVQGISKPGRLLGVNGVFGNMGVAAAPLLVGILVSVEDWRWVFFGPGLVSVVLGLLFWKFVKKDTLVHNLSDTKKTMEDTFIPGWKHVLLVIAAVALIGGLIFNSTTISLPKLFEERLDIVSSKVWDFTLMASIVYAVASMAQIIAGFAVDRFLQSPLWSVLWVHNALSFFSLHSQMDTYCSGSPF